MTYAVVGHGERWFASARTRSGGFMTGSFSCLQDAYAWLFRRGVFEQRNHFDNHAISGAKEEA